MKLILFCTLVALLGPVRGLDVRCGTATTGEDTGFTRCTITEHVTINTDEKVNVVSDVGLNSITEIVFDARGNSRSQVSMVLNEIFEQLSNLETLKLRATVNVLNKGDFEKAGKLKDLTIDNQLKTIPVGVLSSAKNLALLTLSDNQIAEIEDNAFSGLNALIHLDLQSNNLTIIKQNTFNGLEKLKYFNLAFNRIESIEENALNLPNLRIVYINENKLTSLPDNLFATTPLLKIFKANDNEIKHIGKSLYALQNLEKLSLSSNKLTDVDLVALSQMPALTHLYLQEVGLTSDNISRIDVKEEPSTSVLSFLSLEHNELTNAGDWKKIAIFRQLRILNVGDTKYSRIDLGDKTLRQQFPKLQTVYVSSGEWSCDWLKNFVESSKQDGIDIGTTGFSVTGKEVNGIGCV